MTSEQELEKIRIPLDDPERWEKEYGITGLYLNDIAAGALIEVAGEKENEKESVVDRVSRGLRHFRQELWMNNLARPLLAVFFPKEETTTMMQEGMGEDIKKRLQELERLSWDQDQHRGDFSLRRASGKQHAYELLWTLLGDTLGTLDYWAREARLDIRIVKEGLENLKRESTISDPEISDMLTSLHKALMSKLDAFLQPQRGENRMHDNPELTHILRDWAEKQGIEL